MKEVKPLACLINTCHLVGSNLNLKDVLKGVTKMSKDVLHAEAGSLMLLDEKTQLLHFAVALGTKGHKLQKNFSLKVGQGIAGFVAKTGKSLVVADVNKDARFYHKADKAIDFKTRSILAVPLKVRDRIIGVFEVLNPKGKQCFSEEDIPMFEAFACQVAVAIANARMHKQVIEQRRLEQELSIASEIQRSILPSPVLKKKGLCVLAENQPATKVSGDFFDMIDLGENVLVAIGDVAGKGIPAALYMVRIITELRLLINRYSDLNTLIVKLNQQLMSRTTLGMFTTAIFFMVNRREETVSFVNAGHPAPFLMRKEKISVVNSKSGLPLGISDLVPYHVRTINIEKGDSLFAFTDGIIEARNRRGKEFGLLQLKQQLKKFSNKKKGRENIQKLFALVDKFAKGLPQKDDLTAVLIDIL